MRIKFSIADTGSDEIIRRMSAEAPELEIVEIENAESGLRRMNRLDPIVYFVVVFTAHLAASITHEQITKKVKLIFKDKQIQEIEEEHKSPPPKKNDPNTSPNEG